MAEYIERDKAIEAVRSDPMGGLNYKRILTEIPAADVAPVVHGKWIVSHIPDSMLWECDQCGFDCGAHSFNFCPNCGAKMEVM